MSTVEFVLMRLFGAGTMHAAKSYLFITFFIA